MQREKLILVFGGLLFFILGFDALMTVHYIRNLSGPALIAIMSIAAGTFLAIIAAWFCCKKNSPLHLIATAFACKIVLICVGGLCASSIVILYFHEKHIAEKQQNTRVDKAADTQTSLAKAEARRKEIGEINTARERQIQQINEAASKMRRDSVGPQAIKAFVEASMAGLPKVPAEAEPTPDLVGQAEAQNKRTAEENASSGFKAWMLEFSDNGIYYVPTISNLGVFILLSAVLLFTGVIKKEVRTEHNEFPKEIELPKDTRMR